MRALQPLCGLAALTALPPLPDLLEGIERAISELSRSGLEPPTNLGELFQVAGSAIARPRPGTARDRKSTRLNSSHVRISYAVFCLKKKKQHDDGHASCTSCVAA